MTTDPGPLLEVGHITKPHGLAGEVHVTLTTTEGSRLAPGSRLYTRGRVLVVRSSSPHQHRWIVRFADVDTREAAEDLAGAVLSAEAKPEADDGDESTLWVHDLIGATVRDAQGRDHGPVVAVLANPASDLLELASGALVPLRFVVGDVDHLDEGRVVHVDPPEGILD